MAKKRPERQIIAAVAERVMAALKAVDIAPPVGMADACRSFTMEGAPHFEAALQLPSGKALTMQLVYFSTGPGARLMKWSKPWPAPFSYRAEEILVPHRVRLDPPVFWGDEIEPDDIIDELVTRVFDRIWQLEKEGW